MSSLTHLSKHALIKIITEINDFRKLPIEYIIDVKECMDEVLRERKEEAEKEINERYRIKAVSIIKIFILEELYKFERFRECIYKYRNFIENIDDIIINKNCKFPIRNCDIQNVTFVSKKDGTSLSRHENKDHPLIILLESKIDDRIMDMIFIYMYTNLVKITDEEELSHLYQLCDFIESKYEKVICEICDKEIEILNGNFSWASFERKFIYCHTCKRYHCRDHDECEFVRHINANINL